MPRVISIHFLILWERFYFVYKFLSVFLIIFLQVMMAVASLIYNLECLKHNLQNGDFFFLCAADR